MESIREYLHTTEYAVKSQFDIILQYENDNMGEFLKLLKNIKNTSMSDMGSFKNEFDSKIYSKNILAGSILQIAYMGIKLYSNNKAKSNFIKNEEIYINENKYQYKTGNDNKGKKILRNNYKFKFNEKFCTGRNIEKMPIGLIIFAARNQYNHVDERVMELSLENQLILDYVYKLHPEKINDFDLNIYNDANINKYFSYSILNILGWTHLTSKDPYANYKNDMEQIIIN